MTAAAATKPTIPARSMRATADAFPHLVTLAASDPLAALCGRFVRWCRPQRSTVNKSYEARGGTLSPAMGRVNVARRAPRRSASASIDALAGLRTRARSRASYQVTESVPGAPLAPVGD